MERSLEELLDEVTNRESFVRFVEALAAERAAAEEIERLNPDAHVIDGALGWKNATIDNFLLAGLASLDERPLRPVATSPTWRDWAEFLYYGKIYE